MQQLNLMICWYYIYGGVRMSDDYEELEDYDEDENDDDDDYEDD